MIPVAKKREAERVDEYRGVTLMLTPYKIYAMVLAERLRAEIEEKKMDTGKPRQGLEKFMW